MSHCYLELCPFSRGLTLSKDLNGVNAREICWALHICSPLKGTSNNISYILRFHISFFVGSTNLDSSCTPPAQIPSQSLE